MPPTCRRLAVPTAALAGAAAIAALATPGGPAAAASPSLILSPAPRLVAAGPVTIRVRAGAGLTVRLNGRLVTDRFSAPHRGVRAILVSPTHGLRFGRNVVRVSIRRGGRRIVESRSFRVAATRPLAAAGVDRMAIAGARVRLDGARSLLHPPARGQGALRYRWTVVSARGLPRGTRPVLAGSGTPDPRILVPRTGSVTVRLTVTGPDGRSGSDLVQVEADPPPVVRVETQAVRNGRRGVALAGPNDATSAFYAADDARYAWLQVVVLRRDDLSLVSNRTYPCFFRPDDITGGRIPGEAKACAATVDAELAKLSDDDLVVASSPAGSGPVAVRPPVGVWLALKRIGVVPWNWYSTDGFDLNVGLPGGTFSAIGVPGRPSLIVEHPAKDLRQVGTGAITANLVRDNEKRYDVAGAGRAAVQTQAAGSDASRSVIRIGDKVFSRVLVSGGAGLWAGGALHVVVVDPRDLSTTEYFENLSSGGREPGDRVLSIVAALRALRQAAPRPFGVAPVVILTTRGDPWAQLTVGRSELLDELAAWGVSPEQLAQLDADHVGSKDAKTITMVATAGRPLQSSVTIGTTRPPDGTMALNPAPQEALLARSGLYDHWELGTTDPFAASGGPKLAGAAELIGTLDRPKVPWPEEGNAGRTAAVKALGLAVLGTDDPRSQYWTLPYKSADWDRIKAAIAAQTYPSPAPADYTAQDLAWAKAELAKEIGWLFWVHSHIDDLASPFASSQFSSWASFESIVNTIKGDIHLQDDGKSLRVQTEAGFKLAVALASELPLVGKAFETFDAYWDWATELGKLNGEPAESDFDTTVGRAGEGLRRRFEAAQSFMTGYLPDAIASDYDRLRVVGACGSKLAADWADCPFDHAGWTFTSADQKEAAGGIRAAARLTAYGELLPAKYTAWRLPASQYSSPNARYAGLVYFKCWYPFANLPASAMYARRPWRASDYTITAFGSRSGAGTITDPFVMSLPGPESTDPLFGTGDGGLGMDRERFFGTYVTALTPLDHFPEGDTRTGWLPDCQPRSLSGAPTVPASLSLATVARRGLEVAFDVPAANARAEIALLAGRTVVAVQRLSRLPRGRHAVALRLSRAAVRRLRDAGIRTAVVRLRVARPGARASTVQRRIAVRA